MFVFLKKNKKTVKKKKNVFKKRKNVFVYPGVRGLSH